ncbi:MAG: haloalkane dehalogenase [Methanocella sp. PtaU1.Bin125]|nr:MAG: haloalkane dehalogenase [Methanocella sp. PtaU1.Bin125]
MEETTGVNGIKVCYEVRGNGDNLLLLHGNAIGRQAWDGLIAGLSKHYTVYAPDLPGFGCSDMPDIPYNVPFYADYLDRLMQRLGLEKSAVAGVSMGGAVAATLAAGHPDKVTKLILIAPAGLTPPQGGFVKPSRFMDASFWLLSHNRDMFRRSLEELFFDKNRIPEGVAESVFSRMKNPAHRRAILRNVQYMAKADMAFPDMLKAITARTLIVWGREDRVIPVTDAERFAKLIKYAEVVTLARCGHAVPVERAESLADAMLSFLGEVNLYYPAEQ